MIKIKISILLISCLMIFSLSGCIEVDVEDGKVKVNGVKLKHNRTIHLQNSASNKFIAEIYKGKVELQAGSELDLQVKVYEKVLGDVSIFIQNGELLGKTKSGAPYALGSINGTLPEKSEIDIDSGAGNITIKNMINGNILLDTGAGNVKLFQCQSLNLDVDTGAGNIFLENFVSQMIDLDSGAGSIELIGVESDEINCDSGVGNISADNSRAENVSFSTGIGNISIFDCYFENKEFSTGLGKVHQLDPQNTKHKGVEL